MIWVALLDKVGSKGQIPLDNVVTIFISCLQTKKRLVASLLYSVSYCYTAVLIRAKK